MVIIAIVVTAMTINPNIPTFVHGYIEWCWFRISLYTHTNWIYVYTNICVYMYIHIYMYTFVRQTGRRCPMFGAVEDYGHPRHFTSDHSWRKPSLNGRDARKPLRWKTITKVSGNVCDGSSPDDPWWSSWTSCALPNTTRNWRPYSVRLKLKRCSYTRFLINDVDYLHQLNLQQLAFSKFAYNFTTSLVQFLNVL